MRGAESATEFGFSAAGVRLLHVVRPATTQICAIAVAFSIASPVQAETFADGAIDASLSYTVDVVAPLSGAANDDVDVLDNLDLSLSFDLERLAGWRDTVVFFHALNNSGDAPNDAVATLQGVDNIEVVRQSAR